MDLGYNQMKHDHSSLS